MKANDNMPLISIATCTYNAASVLQPTLESVAMQLYDNVEHLIIDGQSADSTVEIASDYRDKMASRGRRVVVVSEKDGGLYFAMNKALALASGQYIVFLNAGDRLHSPSTLGEVASASAESRAGVVYGQTDIVDSNGQFLRPRRLSAPENLSWRSFKRGMVVCHQAFYARTDIARQTAYDTSLRFSADVDWCIRVMKTCEHRGLKLAYTGSIVADFEDGGMSTSYHKASLRERFRVMCRHYGTLQTIALHLYFALRALKKGSKA